MGQKKTIKKEYGMIDIMKFLCSILIVIAHYITENASDGQVNIVLEYGVSLFIIVVPFFFCTAGFLLFTKIVKHTNKWELVFQYCKKLLIMYAGWSVIYCGFKVLSWVRFGTKKSEIIRYFVNAVFYSTYNTIWFLPALMIGVLLTYGFIKKLGFKYTGIIAVLFYCIGTLGVSYSFLLEDNVVLLNLLNKYNEVFVSTRNGVFNGFPFVYIGALIAKSECEKDGKMKFKNSIICFIFTVVFGMAFVVEAFVLKFIYHSVNVNTLIFLLPFTYYYVRWCLSISIQTNRLLLWMRKMSTTIFLCQRIYLTAIPTLFPELFFATILKENAYVGLGYILLSTIITAALLLELSKRSKLFAAIC